MIDDIALAIDVCNDFSLSETKFYSIFAKLYQTSFFCM